MDAGFTEEWYQRTLGEDQVLYRYGEFNRVDARRTDELRRWESAFGDTSPGANFPGQTFYVGPHPESAKSWKATLSYLGAVDLVPLWGFHHKTTHLRMAVRGPGVPSPPVGALIHVEGRKRLDASSPLSSRYVPEITRWSLVDPSEIYRGFVPLRCDLGQVLREISDRFASFALESYLVGAPRTSPKGGGNRLGAFTTQPLLMERLRMAVQLFAPPEYREFVTPVSLFDSIDGVKVQSPPAPRSRHYVLTGPSGEPRKVTQSFRQSQTYPGEQSVLGSAVLRSTRSMNAYTEYLVDWARPELIAPKRLESVSSSPKLREMTRLPTIEHAISIASLRAYSPSVSEIYPGDAVRKLEASLRLVLEDYFPSDLVELQVRILVSRAIKNVLTLAQTRARVAGSLEVRASHVEAATGAYVDCITDLGTADVFAGLRGLNDPENRERAAIKITVVHLGDPDSEEVWDYVANFFASREKFNYVLKSMCEHGPLVETPFGTIQWAPRQRG